MSRDSRIERAVPEKKVFACFPDTLFLVSRAGIILDFKPSEQYLPFLTFAETAGRHISAFLPASAAKTAEDAVAAVLDTGEGQRFEYDMTRAHNKVYFEARVAKADEEKALVIVRDISEWRRSEACDLLLLDILLKVQEEGSLEDILHLVCEGIERIFGVRILWVERKEDDGSPRFFAAGKEAVRFIRENSADLNQGMELTDTALRTAKFQIMDIEDPRMLAWRDRLEQCSVTTGAAFPLKIAGSMLGALTLFSDDHDFWTKQTIVQLTKLAEQVALAIHMATNRRCLRLLRTGLESAANAIVITARNGDIQWVNSAFLELSGYGAAEVMGRNIRIIESGQHPRSFYNAMWRHISVGRIWQGEVTNRRKDGSRYTAEMTITPVRDEQGRIANFISIIKDVTQRKQTEYEMLEAREALARAERLSALGIMAAGIAHEINQPLNALKVVADGILYWYSKGKEPDMASAIKSFQDISKDADRIDAIIKHMRSFIYNSECTEPAACDINVAVKESLLLLGAQLQSHNIEVKTDLADNLPPILGNSTQFEQIIINLLVNAMHALDQEDKPDKKITIGTGLRKGRVWLAVGDNGPGISRKIKNNIFEPFFTTKVTGKGMGLGLSVVQSIVTAYGGEIRVKDNKPAGGVTFRIEFPVAADRQKGAGTT